MQSDRLKLFSIEEEERLGKISKETLRKHAGIFETYLNTVHFSDLRI